MFLEIVTPEASLVNGEVESVTVPGVNGPFQMLNNHAPIVSTLIGGKVLFRGEPHFSKGFENKFSKEKDGKWGLEINSGTVEMNENKIIVLAD